MSRVESHTVPKVGEIAHVYLAWALSAEQGLPLVRRLSGGAHFERTGGELLASLASTFGQDEEGDARAALALAGEAVDMAWHAMEFARRLAPEESPARAQLEELLAAAFPGGAHAVETLTRAGYFAERLRVVRDERAAQLAGLPDPVPGVPWAALLQRSISACRGAFAHAGHEAAARPTSSAFHLAARAKRWILDLRTVAESEVRLNPDLPRDFVQQLLEKWDALDAERKVMRGVEKAREDRAKARRAKARAAQKGADESGKPRGESDEEDTREPPRDASPPDDDEGGEEGSGRESAA